MQLFFSKTKSIFKSIFCDEKEKIFIYNIIFFCFGSFVCVYYLENINIKSVISSFVLMCFSVLLLFLYKKRDFLYIITLFCAFLVGFNISYLNQIISGNYNKITGKVFVNVKGKIDELSEFENKKTKRKGLSLVLKDITLYESAYEGNYEKRLKEPKTSEKFRYRNFMNFYDFQELDYEFLLKKDGYQEVFWQENSEKKKVYPRPPPKIRVFASQYNEKLENGDLVYFKAVLLPIDKPDFINSFDFRFYNLSKDIGSQGYAISPIKILKKHDLGNFSAFIKNLRVKIQKKIEKGAKKEQSAIIKALLTGDRSNISEDKMENIRNSGLAHLIAISGLHLSLCAGIFFFLFRFILLQNSYITLNFDIKKIAAIFAILGSFVYLQIAGAPISAQRAFYMVCLAMMAIFFDRRSDLLRIVAVAAFVIVLINPYAMFSAGFQLSFAAVLSICAFHEIWSRLYDKFITKESLKNSKIVKFLKYFFEMVFISFVAQIANSYFLIYHFGKLALYGSLSNLIAIPLTSFVLMPLGFLSLFLMIFELEGFGLNIMSYGVMIIEETAKYVANLQNSFVDFPQIPKYGLVISIFSGLFFVVLKNKYLRILSFSLFCASFLTIEQANKPNILIDGDANFFALYSKDKGLIFSKKLKKSNKLELWLKKMQVKDFLSFQDYSHQDLGKWGINCYREYCEVNLERFFDDKSYKLKKALFIKERIKISDICQKDFDLVVNLTKKYKLPKCMSARAIDNFDLLNYGSHFIYLNENNEFKIKKVD